MAAENPYRAPREFEDGSPAEPEGRIRYRTFHSPQTMFRLTIHGIREPVRREACQAIEQEIGADNVISIHEHSESFGNFSVTVWYRSAD